MLTVSSRSVSQACYGVKRDSWSPYIRAWAWCHHGHYVALRNENQSHLYYTSLCSGSETQSH